MYIYLGKSTFLVEKRNFSSSLLTFFSEVIGWLVFCVFHFSKEGPDCAAASSMNACLGLVKRTWKENKRVLCLEWRPIHLPRMGGCYVTKCTILFVASSTAQHKFSGLLKMGEKWPKLGWGGRLQRSHEDACPDVCIHHGAGVRIQVFPSDASCLLMRTLGGRS